jgi:hypothetical protein
VEKWALPAGWETVLGLFLFGSAAAWLGMENKLVVGLVAIVALYAIIRTVSAFARA